MRIQSEKLEQSEVRETEPLSEVSVAHLLPAVLVPVSSSPALQPLSMYVQSTRGRARHKMWLLALVSILSVHAIDITNEFVDEDADAVIVEGGILVFHFFLSRNTLCNGQSM